MRFSLASAVLCFLSVVFDIQPALARLVVRQSNKGDATFYDPSSNTGACGWSNKQSDMICAISHQQYDQYTSQGGKSNKCGNYVTVTYPQTGKSIDVKVVDRCEGCKVNDLDLSQAAFNALAGGPDAGQISVNWHFH